MRFSRCSQGTEFLSTMTSVVENLGLKITVIICLLNCIVLFRNFTFRKVQVGVYFPFPWIPYVFFLPKIYAHFPKPLPLYFAFWFETRSHSIVQDSLELKAILCLRFPVAGIMGMSCCTQLPGVLTLLFQQGSPTSTA